MPKLRMTGTEVQDALLRRAVKGSAGYFGLSGTDQAQIAGCTRAMWYRRLRCPGDFTLAELRRMVRRYKWSALAVAGFLGARDGSWEI